MTRLTALSSPLLLGFDELERRLDRAARSAGDGYPPYNIERIKPNGNTPETLLITLALAGFTQQDLDITVEKNQLTVSGKQEEESGRVFLHRGIAARHFHRAFVLADGIEVSGAEIDNGLLHIDLLRPQPKVKRHQIAIRSSNGPTAVGPRKE